MNCKVYDLQMMSRKAYDLKVVNCKVYSLYDLRTASPNCRVYEMNSSRIYIYIYIYAGTGRTPLERRRTEAPEHQAPSTPKHKALLHQTGNRLFTVCVRLERHAAPVDIMGGARLTNLAHTLFGIV